MTIKAIRGTRDLLPPDTDLWNFVEERCAGVRTLQLPRDSHSGLRGHANCSRAASVKIRTSSRKRCSRGKIKARAQSEKSQSLTLRPENTAGVVRAYIEHELGRTGQLQKLYYIGPQFRRERPQKGRYRQFYQIGAEIIGPPIAGSESPIRDAEVIEMLARCSIPSGCRAGRCT